MHDYYATFSFLRMPSNKPVVIYPSGETLYSRNPYDILVNTAETNPETLAKALRAWVGKK